MFENLKAVACCIIYVNTCLIGPLWRAWSWFKFIALRSLGGDFFYAEINKIITWNRFEKRRFNVVSKEKS